MKPAIIIIAYNREDCLNRLLTSLSLASYQADDITLVISIDHSDNPKVLEVAEAFHWNHGNKKIIAHSKNLGLRKHVLSCGDLIERFGAAVILEDDLYVAPTFYNYASACLQFYAADIRIAGISLYTHRTNVNCYRPFEPLHDGSDVFFLQFASSWGQAWTVEQWRAFRAWFDSESSPVTDHDFLPPSVVSWPESSWLKYFIKYMVCNDLYFVYPRNSQTTNFCDPGTHNSSALSLFQVPLQVRHACAQWDFHKLADSLSLYDVFFELLPTSLNREFHNLDTADLTVDLYGTKPLACVKTRYILTCRPCGGEPIAAFGCSLKPRDANVLLNSPGDRFALMATDTAREMIRRPPWEMEYDLNLLADNVLSRFVLGKIIAWIKRKFLKWA